MPLTIPPDLSTPIAIKKRYVLPAASGGSDSNNGRSWQKAYATVAQAVSDLGGSTGQGDIYIGPGTHVWADTITLGQSVRLHGTSWQSAAGLGTELVWTGANDGRAGLITASSASADLTKGVIEDIRFSGDASTGGGGVALSLRQIQNGSVFRNVHVTNWKTGPCFKLWDSTATGTNQPGYVRFDNCWAGGGTYGWWIEAGTTPLLFNLCSSDPNAETLYPWYIKNKDYSTPIAITACTQSGAVATFTAVGHGIDAGRLVKITGITPAGYNGIYRVTSVPTDTFTCTLDTTGLADGSAFGQAQKLAGGARGESIFIACKTEYSIDVDTPTFLIEATQRVQLIGVSARKGTLGTKAFVQWDGPLVDEHGGKLMVPPLTMTACQAQNLPYALVASRFGGDNVDLTIATGTTGDGRAFPVSFMPHTASPLFDVRQTATPSVNPPSGTRRVFTDAATGELSVLTSAGATVSLEASAGGAPTTADYLVGTAQGGLSAEIVVGATPGGELGGTWGTPTVDATHAGTTHTAATDTHIADTTTAHAAASVDAIAIGGGGTEAVKAVGATGSTETIALTLTDGNVQTFTVDANCTFTMPSGLTSGVAKSFTAILTDSGGPRTITFTGVKWSGGTDPTVMSGASAIDIFTFLTIDGGTTWYGFVGGTGMAT